MLTYRTHLVVFTGAQGRVAQLDRATDYGSVGRGFESCRARQSRHGARRPVFLFSPLLQPLAQLAGVTGVAPTPQGRQCAN